MKKMISISLSTILLSGCVTMSKDSPEIQSALKQSRLNVHDCLTEQILSLVKVYPEPQTISQVAASRCEFTAMQEAQKLKKLNTSRAYIEGYTGRLTDREELERQAVNILMRLIEDANSE